MNKGYDGAGPVKTGFYLSPDAGISKTKNPDKQVNVFAEMSY